MREGLQVVDSLRDCKRQNTLLARDFLKYTYEFLIS